MLMTQFRRINPILTAYRVLMADLSSLMIKHLQTSLRFAPLDYLNSRFTQTFLTAILHLSTKLSREFRTLLPVNSDFTLTKLLNSRENFRVSFILYAILSTAIHHFCTSKLPHSSRFYVINMSFLCRFYVINDYIQNKITCRKSAIYIAIYVICHQI